MLIVTLKDIWTWTCLHALMANQWQRYILWTDSIDCSFTTSRWIDCLINVLRVENFLRKSWGTSWTLQARPLARPQRRHRKCWVQVISESAYKDTLLMHQLWQNKVSKVDDKRWRGIVTLNPSQVRYPKKSLLGTKVAKVGDNIKGFFGSRWVLPRGSVLTLAASSVELDMSFLWGFLHQKSCSPEGLQLWISLQKGPSFNIAVNF